MSSKTSFSPQFDKVLLAWLRPFQSMIFALVIYLTFASLRGFKPSGFNYYVYLSDAFLHGQLDLRLLPESLHDLIVFNDKVYLYWLPMPAILLMPLVAIFGIGINDVLLSVGFGAFNVFLFVRLLQAAQQRGLHNLLPKYQALLAIFFAFGTVHITLTPYGKVWHTGQEISLMFMLLAYLAVISQRGWKAFLFTGMALTGAMLTRGHLIFVGIWPAYYLLHTHWDQRYKKLIGLTLLASLPIVLGGLGVLEYNWLRFGAPFEMGLDYHLMSSFFAADYELYGPFNWYYVPINLYYQLLYYPFPLQPNEWAMGGSLFLLSPVFFAIFSSFGDKSRRVSHSILVITMLVVYIPIVFLMGTGWVQFGPRYLLDLIVPLLLLTAAGLEKWRWKWFVLLTVISCSHYFIGTALLALLP